MSLVAVALVIYSLQLFDAVQLLSGRPNLQAAAGQVNVLFGVYAFALVRSWQLLGARRGMISSILGTGLTDESTDEAGSGRAANADRPAPARKADPEPPPDR